MVELLRDIVAGGYCIGCGACVAQSTGELTMKFDEYGMLKPYADDDFDDGPMLSVCPFSDSSADETDIATEHWPEKPVDQRLGRFGDMYAGNIINERDRLAGSSGGLTTWLLRELMSKNIVDRVVHVKATDPTSEPMGRLFRYEVSSTIDELDAGRGSRYYPIELSATVEAIRKTDGRYAVVAIPCFARALRNLMNNDPILKKRVIYIVGLVCGHLKSRHFADFVAATQGFPPGGYKTVSFRKKLPGRPASDYTISVTGSGNTVHGRPLKEYFATSWEVGAFRNPACDFCDDVLAETADIVFGDAWIPPFDQDWLGTNVVLTRNDTLAQIMRDGFAKGQIALTPITADQMAKSQAGGLRHRREGLSYRLAERRTAGNWTPQKRFEGSPDDVPGGRKAVYRQRQRLTEISHKAFRLASRYGGKLVFTLAMTGPVFRYYATVGNLKRAVAQTPAGRWLKRQLSERR